MGQAWANAKSFRITMETNDPAAKDQSGQITMEVVRPDREHIKFNMGGQNIETITIGKDNYVSLAGKWTKTTSKTDQTSLANPQTVVDDFNQSIDANTKITKGGATTVNGKPCQEWKVEDTGSNADESSSGTMCIGQDNLPVQFKDTAGKYLMTFSDWNASIDIKPPI